MLFIDRCVEIYQGFNFTCVHPFPLSSFFFSFLSPTFPFPLLSFRFFSCRFPSFTSPYIPSFPFYRRFPFFSFLFLPSSPLISLLVSSFFFLPFYFPSLVVVLFPFLFFISLLLLFSSLPSSSPFPFYSRRSPSFLLLPLPPLPLRARNEALFTTPVFRVT